MKKITSPSFSQPCIQQETTNLLHGSHAQISPSIWRGGLPTGCAGHAMRVPEDLLSRWFCDHLLKVIRPDPSRF